MLASLRNATDDGASAPEGIPIIPIIHRPLISLLLPGPIGLLISFVRTVLLAIAGHKALFPNPSPALATVDTAISDLEKAQADVQARVKGAPEQRAVKRAALLQLVEALRNYVQGVADLDPANAAAIIQAAGFTVRKVSARGRRVFAAKPDTASGSVVLVAPSGGRPAFYDWQWSTDGGKTWQSAPSTSLAKTTIHGLAVGSTVSFRCRVNTRAGEGEWSQPIALLVK